MKRIPIFMLWTLPILLLIASAGAQQPLKVRFVVTESYPSLTSIPLIQVKVGEVSTLGTDPCKWPAGFDPTSVSNYRVTTDKGTAVHVDSVQFLPFPPGQITCPGGQTIAHSELELTSPFLAVNAGLHNKDKLNITLLNGATELAKTTEPVEVKGLPEWTFTVDPQAVPGEKLINGNKRDVGQFKVNLSTPDLFKWHLFRTYLQTTDVISTDEKDSNSKIDATFGLEHNLTPAWYIPAHLESKVLGDQVARNLSYLESFGLSTLLPWKGLKPALFNPAIQAPVSPVISLDAQYEHRINQDANSLKKFPNSNDFRLNPGLSWTPIRFLPGLTQRIAQSPDLLSFEINIKAWYLPFDQTAPKDGRQRFEAGGDVSLLVPLQPFARLKVLGPALALLAPNQNGLGKTRIRIKYSAGANDANGFKHSRQWSYGIEASK